MFGGARKPFAAVPPGGQEEHSLTAAVGISIGIAHPAGRPSTNSVSFACIDPPALVAIQRQALPFAASCACTWKRPAISHESSTIDKMEHDAGF